MKVFSLIVAPALVAALKQDPCAGCDETQAYQYQKCAYEHGNACAETNEAGIVTSGQGTKKDVGCCMKTEKHFRCLECKSMDCEFNTCNVNKKYYEERTLFPTDPDWDKKAMKAAGWGDF